jgi:predicted dithiol-disulfide oxidoreductase (DUF899 family)
MMGTSAVDLNQDLSRKVVSRSEWLDTRKAFLAKEKALTRQRDALAKERLELPWVRVEKDYVFETSEGKKTLAELFGDKKQLLLHHFMFGPEWEQGCPGCSLTADTSDPNIVHLTQRDVAFVAVSRAPLSRIAPFQQRMGWSFPWVSSFGSDFNFDFGVSFTPEEMVAGKRPYNYGSIDFPSDEGPGFSAFYKNKDGEVFHTYSTYGRGGEGVLGVYALLDMVPLGRNEEGIEPHPMAWVRHHDKYEGAPQKHGCCGGAA